MVYPLKNLECGHVNVSVGDYRRREEVYDTEGQQGPGVPTGYYRRGPKNRRTKPHLRVAEDERGKGKDTAPLPLTQAGSV